jgi:hypothetical protein
MAGRIRRVDAPLAERGGGELGPLAQWLLGVPPCTGFPRVFRFWAWAKPDIGLRAVSGASLRCRPRWSGDLSEREAEIALRQRNAATLLKSREPGGIAPIPGARPGWLRLPVLVENPAESPEESLRDASFDTSSRSSRAQSLTRPSPTFRAPSPWRRGYGPPHPRMVSASVRARLGAGA